MKDFYPEIKPYNTLRLQASPLHNLYVEEVGNPQGKPVVFLHGGPGGGISPDHRRYFDPKTYRIILFDQRGCGQSTPFAELQENTTWDLVSDIEKIRETLKIDRWLVFGGSWGSTLALAYAETHPEKTTGLILRGIFLCRPTELQWFYQDGASRMFPDHWETYKNHIPEIERKDFIAAYYQRLTSTDRKVQLAAARVWSQWEMSTSYLNVSKEAIESMEGPEKALPFARIEAHYFINKAFFQTDNFLLENANKIKDIPAVIVQGRYDVVCPPTSAWDLHKALPNSKLQFIPGSGHSAAEPGIRSALIEATDSFR